MLRRICEWVSKDNWKNFPKIRLQIFEKPMNSVTRESIRRLSKEISPALVVFALHFSFVPILQRFIFNKGLGANLQDIISVLPLHLTSLPPTLCTFPDL